MNKASHLFTIATDLHGHSFVTAWFVPSALGQQPHRNASMIRQVLDGVPMYEVASNHGLSPHPELVRQRLSQFLRSAFPSIPWHEMQRRSTMTMTKAARLHRGWILRALKHYERLM